MKSKMALEQYANTTHNNTINCKRHGIYMDYSWVCTGEVSDSKR